MTLRMVASRHRRAVAAFDNRDSIPSISHGRNDCSISETTQGGRTVSGHSEGYLTWAWSMGVVDGRVVVMVDMVDMVYM